MDEPSNTTSTSLTAPAEPSRLYPRWPDRIKEPIPGYPIGSMLPGSELPDTPDCPFCDHTFKDVRAMRGHAFARHGIRWDSTKVAEPSWMTKLAPWHFTAFALRELYGLSWKEIGKRLEKSARHLRKVYEFSPAAQEYIDRLREMFSDPEAVAAIIMRANTINVSVDYLMALEWAKSAKDYRAVRDFTKDMMPPGVLDRGATANPTQNQAIHIHLDADTLDTPRVRSSYKEVKVEDADWSDE